MPASISPREPVEVAIIGGGIVGLVLAAGLLRRNIKVQVFEQAQGFREIGAGIAFTASAIRCMEQIDPAVVTALRSGGSVPTSSEGDQNDYLRWVNGYTEDEDDPQSQRLLYKLDAGYRGFEGTRRDQFLENLVKVFPPAVIHCRKRLASMEERGPEEKIILTFVDGTAVEADAVIGCDGIKSRVREMLLGEGNPASYPHYTHKVAYRALIPMHEAINALGDYKAQNQHNHVGPNAHLIHYPVANNKMINATAFISDPQEWPDDKQMVAPGCREDLQKVFADWSRSVRKVIDRFPEKPEKWAVYDLWDYPAPFYNQRKVCLAGDAAHASSPHHGAGAGMGIEDALCLATLLQQVDLGVRDGRVPRGKAISAAFQTYDAVRRTRTQWLVNSSRRMCDFYHQPEWADPTKLVKAETCFEEMKDRSYKIWHFDSEGMLKDTIREYNEREAALLQESS